MKIRWFLAISLVMWISGCASMNIEQFEDKSPAFSIESYFLGKTRAWGIFEDRFGDLRREFTVDISGTLEQDTLVLDEHFEYTDGETDRRVWRIRILGDGHYEGSADDITGVATGVARGNALNWQYNMDLPVNGSTWNVHFDDWMFLQSDDVLINRATVSKWGFEVGTVTLFFQRDEQQ